MPLSALEAPRLSRSMPCIGRDSYPVKAAFSACSHPILVGKRVSHVTRLCFAYGNCPKEGPMAHALTE